MAKNANNATYELAEIGDKKVLFTDSRIDRATIPEGLYCYDIRHSDEDWGEAATLERVVCVNYMGTVICAKPFDFSGGDYLDVYEIFHNFAKPMDINEYRAKFLN